MSSCKDCLNEELCEYYLKETLYFTGRSLSEILDADKCRFFKDRSKFIELPELEDYTTVKTLDEAIDHCFSIVNSTDENICAECKAEHLRLCGWLGELKRRRKAEQALRESEVNVNL